MVSGTRVEACTLHQFRDPEKRREESREIGGEAACWIAYRAQECETAADDIVEQPGRFAAPHLTLDEQVAGAWIAVHEHPGTDRGCR